MSQKIKGFFTKIFPTVLLTTLIVGTIVYAWQEPTQNPPGGNVPAPINVGSQTQYKSGGLGIGGVFETYTFTNLALTESGGICARPRPFPTVGIGLRCPTTKLDVAGDIKARGNIILARLPTPRPIPGRELVLESWSTDMTTEYSEQTEITRTEWQNGQEECRGQNKTIQFVCDARYDADGYTCLDYYIVDGQYPAYFKEYATCHAGTSKYSIRTDSGTLQFLNTADEIKFVIGQDGNVGIGTTAPSYKLEVVGDIKSTRARVIGDQLCLVDYEIQPPTLRCISNWNQVGGGDGGFWTQTGTNLYPSNLNWNVGIGTNTPGSKLEVAGETRINPPSGNSILTFQIGGSEKAQIYAASSDGSLRFRTPGNDQMVILPTGNVGIGTTAPNQKLSIVNGNVSLVDGNIYLSNTEYCVPGGGWYYTRNLVNIPEHKTDYPRCSCDQNDATKDCDEVFSAGNQTAAYCYDWWRYESGYPRSDRYKREYYSSGQCMWTPAPQIHFTDLETPAWTYTLKNKVGTLQFISGMDPNTPRLTIGADGNTTISGKLGTAGYTSTQNLPSGWGGGVNTWDVVAQASIAAKQICLDSNPDTPQWEVLNCVRGSWPMGYWTQSDSNLYPNNTAWNVGIGTTNPQSKLEIAGETTINPASGSSILNFKINNLRKAQIYYPQSGNDPGLKFKIEEKDVVRINKLGIKVKGDRITFGGPNSGGIGYLVFSPSAPDKDCDQEEERGTIFSATVYGFSNNTSRDCLCWCGLRENKFTWMCVCP